MDQLLRATADAEARHFWFRGFRLFVTPLLCRAAAHRPNLRLLDCGCGTGANVEMLARFGRAFGFDLTMSGLEIGTSLGRTRLARATVVAAPFRASTFDIVTSFDVLYALGSDVECQAVAEMHRVLKPGGHLLVNVAAMPVLRGNHSVLSREVRRYTRADLSRLLRSAGFAIERLTYTNATLFLPMLGVRALQRARGLGADDGSPGIERDITVPAGPVNALLTGALALESAWVRVVDNPFGSSLLCLATKPA